MGAAAVPLMVASTALNSYGAYKKGQDQQTADNYNAGQTEASGQIAALNQDKNTSLMVSRARAVAAASGGSATDDTVSNIMARIAGEGQYRADTDRYQGASQGQALRYHGQQAEKAGELNAIGTLIGGSAKAYSMYSKYGGSTPGGKDGYSMPNGESVPS